MTLQRASISVWTAFVLLLSGFIVAEYHLLKAVATSKPVVVATPLKKFIYDYTTIEHEKVRLEERNKLLTLAYAPSDCKPEQTILNTSVSNISKTTRKKKAERLLKRGRKRARYKNRTGSTFKTQVSKNGLSKNSETAHKAVDSVSVKTQPKRRLKRRARRSLTQNELPKSSSLKRKALKNATVRISRIRPATADASWKRLQREALFAWPLKAEDFWVSSLFGPRRLGGRQGFHAGIDLAAVRGTPVHAAAAGVVLEACYSAGYGNYILIAHNRKFKTRYAHLDKILVQVGRNVLVGDCIGRVGATGFVRKSRRSGSASHLHFEVYMKGKAVNPFFFLA